MIITNNMSTIPQLFGGRMPQSDSDNVVLAPPNINPRSAPSLQPDEFKLYGKVYVRCCSLAKHLRRPGNGSQLSGNMVRIFSSERIQQKLQNGTGTAISVRKSGVNRSFPSSFR